MKRLINRSLLIVFSMFIAFLFMDKVSASYQGMVTSGVNFRKGPSTSYGIYTEIKKGSYVEVLSLNTTSGGGCGAGWLNISYGGHSGYVCASYIYIDGNDIFLRPWTSPKKAIVGGAKFIGSQYIHASQYTSYLKKFNVASNNMYTHQYMGNLRAPWSEAKTSYNAYSKAGILESAFTFSIPIYNNMNDSYALPGTDFDVTGLDIVEDQEFEAKLDAQGFPESYKRRLRFIHKQHPTWVFESIKVNVNFATVVENEFDICVIDGSNTSYRHSENYSSEKGWYTPNRETTAYFLDPRNFIFNQERILQFEKLYYNDIYTEATVQAVLNGTFMSGTSTLDNQTYASLFVEAGRTNNINPVYLASLSKQEVTKQGGKGSKAVTGEEFTYKGITYKGLYNFYNIGAYASEESPVLAGLVWGSVGYNFSNVTLVNNNSNGNNNSGGNNATTPVVYTPTVKKGDVNGDGSIDPIDLLRVKQHLIGKITLTGNDAVAADTNGDGSIDPIDLLRVKQHLLGRINLN